MRVDFYLVDESDRQAGWLLVCRLIEKAYGLGHKIFVFCENQIEANGIDELLWTFKDDSFIPHNLQGEGPEPPPMVQIGFEGEPRGFNDILINMSSNIPPFHSRFNRIMEIVVHDDQAKEISRQHYRQYRSLGYELKTHPMESTKA